MISPLTSENIRGSLRAINNFDGQNPEKKEFVLGIDEISSINVTNLDFLKGLEVEIKIPPLVQNYRGAFAVFFYQKILPKPNFSVKSYFGTRIKYFVIPVKNRIYIQIPFSSELLTQLPSDTLTLNRILSLSELPLFIVIQPVMKGIPEKVSNSRFSVSIKSLLKEKGVLALNVHYPAGFNTRSFSIVIDGKKIAYPENEYVMPVGMHKLQILSSVLNEKNISFGIETGKRKTLNIELTPLTSQIRISGPEKTIIYLDGKKIIDFSGKSFPIEPGEHSIIYKIGDYSLTKKFTILKGKTYDISLFLDILIQEN